MSKKFSLKRLHRDENGATAIEFSMLVLPFLLTLFAIIETSLSFTAGQVLANGTDTMARKIRTGQIDPATMTLAQFRTDLCNEISVMMPSGCPELHIDVRQYNRYRDVPTTLPVSGGRVNSSGFRFSPGGPGTINSMRVVYEWPVMTDIMKEYMSNLDGGKILLYSTHTWRNEP